MKIAIGLDHAGFGYKEVIRKYLIESGHEVKDFGTYSDASCDYPVFIRPVAEAVARGEFERGYRDWETFDFRCTCFSHVFSLLIPT